MAESPAAQNRGRSLQVSFTFSWKLLLHSSESLPEVHVYLSSTHTNELPRIVPLRTASGTITIAHKFELKPSFDGSSAAHVIEGCVLNLDFQVRTQNDYEEDVPNSSGSVLIPLYKLAHAAAFTGVSMPVVFFQVHDQDIKQKGSVDVTPVVLSGTRTRLPILTLDDVPITSLDATPALMERAEKRASLARDIIAMYIQATGAIFTSLEPTLESVSNINSERYDNRAGLAIPVAFTMDVREPIITVGFYEACSRVARRRMRPRMRVSELLAIDVESKDARPTDIKRFASFAGNVLTAYVSQCTYRSDFSMVYSRSSGTFDKKPTENFGDVSVDEGSGDCEDFGKMIIRIYNGVIRLYRRGEFRNSPLLTKLAEFLDCFVPLLVLLGVSSVQINAAPKDIMHMGAHENAVLMPTAQFMEALGRFDANARIWTDTLASQDPREAENVERSKRYSTIILEGTGILEPVASIEESIRARIVFEEGMEEGIFYDFRRTYFFRELEGQTSFYKTAEKVQTVDHFRIVMITDVLAKACALWCSVWLVRIIPSSIF